MTYDQILAKVGDVVRDTLDLESISLSPGMTAADIPGWDSLAHVQIMVGIEQAFGIRFRTGEMAALGNIGDLVKRIERRLDGAR